MLGIMALNTVKLWKPWTLVLFLDCYYVGKENQSDTRRMKHKLQRYFIKFVVCIFFSWFDFAPDWSVMTHEHSKVILSVHGFSSRMLIIALRNNTVCFGVFMPGSPQTEPAWLSRPVWLIGLLRSSNTGNIFVQPSSQQCCVATVWLIGLLRSSNAGNIFVQPSSQQCCVASWECLLHVLPPLHITNFHVAKVEATNLLCKKVLICARNNLNLQRNIVAQNVLRKCCSYFWALIGQWAKLAWLAMLAQFAEILA